MKRLKLVFDGILVMCVAFGAVGCQSHGHPSPIPPTSPKASSHAKSWEVQQAGPPLQDHPVNGCEPYGTILGGFCISTYPIWTESSAGMTLWSGIAVGATVEIEGATIVSAKTRKPYFSAIEVTGPGGFKAMLPVAPNGGYDEKIAFPSEGEYQMGVVLDGKQQQGISFYVPYVPHPQGSTTLTDVFPDSLRKLPNDVVLVYPGGANTSAPVLFTDVEGHPAANVSIPIWNNGKAQTVTTNAQGVARMPLSSSGPYNPEGAYLNSLYGALFSLQYVTANVSRDIVTAWPKFTTIKPTSLQSPQTISQDGVTYYETSVAIARLDPVAVFAGSPGGMWRTGASYDSSTEVLTLRPASFVQTVTISPDGTVSAPEFFCWQSCKYVAPHPLAHVQPIVQGGNIYLDVPDLVKVLNTFAWASLSPAGQLRVADFWEP